MVYKLTQQICYLCEGSIVASPTHSYQHLCAFCLAALAKEQPACFRCGIAIPHIEGSNKTVLHCGDCLAKQPLQYRSVCAVAYRFPLPELIGQLKFQKQLAVVPCLAELFTLSCKAYYESDCLPQAVLSIPLHARREFKRGFNQAEVLALPIGKQLNIKVLKQVVLKSRATPSQMSLGIEQRHLNVQGAFSLARNHGLESFNHIALFDDVITTGATMHAVAALLKQAGVQRVDFWSLARTPKS